MSVLIWPRQFSLCQKKNTLIDAGSGFLRRSSCFAFYLCSMTVNDLLVSDKVLEYSTSSNKLHGLRSPVAGLNSQKIISIRRMFTIFTIFAVVVVEIC